MSGDFLNEDSNHDTTTTNNNNIAQFFNDLSSMFHVNDTGDDDANMTAICSQWSGIVAAEQLPYLIMIAASPFFIFAISWLVQRRRDRRRPGCPTPIPIVDPCRRRLFYAAFWGMVAYETFQFFLSREQLVISTRCFTGWQIPLILLVNVFLYAFLFYPIAGGFSTDCFIGYLIATLWTWAIAALRGMDIYSTVIEESNVGEKIADVFEEILPLLFILFLSIYLPFQTGLALISVVRGFGKFYEPVQRPIHFKMLPECLYVRELLKHRDPFPKPVPCCRRFLDAITYRNLPYFRYSQTIISTVVISSVFIYYVMYGYFRVVSILVLDFRSVTFNITSQLAELLNVTRSDRTVRIVEAYFDSLSYSLIAAGILVCVIQLVLLATVLPCYRRDMTGAYRGNYDFIVPPTTNPPRTYFGNAIRYMGSQAVMFAWGCFLQLILFSLIGLAIAWIVVVPLVYGFGWWIINKFISVLPAVGITIGLMIIQMVVVTLFWVQDYGKTMAVDNRRGYSNFAYVAFFNNLLIGLVGAVIRLILSAVFGVVMFSRLDLPILNRRLERLDGSFNVYIGLVHVENYHTNPCLITFVNIIIDAMEQQRALRAAELSAPPSSPSKKKEPLPLIIRRSKFESIELYDGEVGVDVGTTNGGFEITESSSINKRDSTSPRPTTSSRTENDSAYGGDSDHKTTAAVHNYANFPPIHSPLSVEQRRQSSTPAKDEHVGVELAKVSHPRSSQASTTILLAEERIAASYRASAMRFKWHLAYTLIRNPRLIAERKIVLGITLI